jgi:hypothetical protein
MNSSAIAFHEIRELPAVAWLDLAHGRERAVDIDTELQRHFQLEHDPTCSSHATD